MSVSVDYQILIPRIERELEEFCPSLCPILHNMEQLYGAGANGEVNTQREAYILSNASQAIAFWEYNFDLLCLILADLGEL